MTMTNASCEEEKGKGDQKTLASTNNKNALRLKTLIGNEMVFPRKENFGDNDNVHDWSCGDIKQKLSKFYANSIPVSDILIIQGGKRMLDDDIILNSKCFVLVKSTSITKVSIPVKIKATNSEFSIELSLTSRGFHIKREIQRITKIKTNIRMILGSKMIKDDYNGCVLGDYLLASMSKFSPSSASVSIVTMPLPTLYISKSTNLKEEVNIAALVLKAQDPFTFSFEIGQKLKYTRDILYRKFALPLEVPLFYFIKSTNDDKSSSVDAEMIQLDMNRSLFDHGISQIKRLDIYIIRDESGISKFGKIRMSDLQLTDSPSARTTKKADKSRPPLSPCHQSPLPFTSANPTGSPTSVCANTSPPIISRKKVPSGLFKRGFLCSKKTSSSSKSILTKKQILDQSLEEENKNKENVDNSEQVNDAPVA